MFSKVIRQMYADANGYVSCATCGVTRHWKDDMQGGHFIPKSRGTSVYFECSNVHVQCKSCNCNQFDKESVKIRYTLWMEDHYGRDEIDRLEQLAKTTVKYTRQDYIDMQEHYKMCLEEL